MSAAAFRFASPGRSSEPTSWITTFLKSRSQNGSLGSASASED
jgi:hypothetical protein